MSFTAKDVELAFNESESDYYELEEAEGVDLGELGKTEYVDDFGGEGQGDERWIVFKVQDRLFRVGGYYNSWEGTEWDGEVEEVKAVQVQRTEYEAI